MQFSRTFSQRSSSPRLKFTGLHLGPLPSGPWPGDPLRVVSDHKNGHVVFLLSLSDAQCLENRCFVYFVWLFGDFRREGNSGLITACWSESQSLHACGKWLKQLGSGGAHGELGSTPHPHRAADTQAPPAVSPQ